MTLPQFKACRHCKEHIPKDDLAHEHEHEGLCCDCFDLSLGMPLAALNRERAGKGKGPLQPMSVTPTLVS